MNTLHAIIDPNIFCMFRAGNSRFCTTFAENPNIFLRISRLGKPSEMLQIVEPRFLGPASEAPGHCRPWRPPRRLCSAKARPPRRGRSAPPSAAASNLKAFSPGGPSAAVAEAAGNDERCGQLSSTRSTDKRGMNLLGSTSSKLFKTKNKSQTH